MDEQNEKGSRIPEGAEMSGAKKRKVIPELDAQVEAAGKKKEKPLAAEDSDDLLLDDMPRRSLKKTVKEPAAAKTPEKEANRSRLSREERAARSLAGRETAMMNEKAQEQDENPEKEKQSKKGFFFSAKAEKSKPALKHSEKTEASEKKETSAEKMPEKKAAEKKVSAKKLPEKKITDQKLSAAKEPSVQKIPVQKTAKMKLSEKKEAEKAASETEGQESVIDRLTLMILEKPAVKYGVLGVIALVIILVGIAVATSAGSGKDTPAATAASLSTSASADSSIPTIIAPTNEETSAEEPSEEAKASETVPAETTEAVVSQGELVQASNTVNVRALPDVSSESLGKLSTGETIYRTANENGWSTVEYNGVTAYISSDFLTPVSEGTVSSAAVSETSVVAGLPTTGPTEASTYTTWPDLSLLDTTSYNFGYAEVNRDPVTRIPTDWKWYESQWGQHNVDWIQDTSKMVVYLTMDEGFGNDQTITILDTLKEKGVHIVFFVTENFYKARPELIQRMIDEGHTIGNHTCTHPDMTSLSLDDAISQVMTLNNEILETYGYQMKLFRFPEGRYSDETLGIIDNLGYKTVFWTFGYDDYSSDPVPLDEAKELIWNNIHPGAIFLLHANSDVNMTLLGDFIDEVRSRGYEFGEYPLTAN